MSKLARENNTASKTVEADRLHTMFLAMADARAVLIKLADRLHNMMTLDALPLCKQQRFAKETLEIFVPLANRLGISTWKVQLENLCFKHLNPDQHTELSSKLVECFDEAMITSAIEKLEQALKDKNISFLDLCGRHKSLYSIHCKMLKYALPSLPNLVRESFATEYSSLSHACFQKFQLLTIHGIGHILWKILCLHYLSVIIQLVPVCLSHGSQFDE